MAHPQKIHFHIQWYLREELDWEAFASVTEATMIADAWVHRGKTYTIQQRDESCSRCAEQALKAARRERFGLKLRRQFR